MNTVAEQRLTVFLCLAQSLQICYPCTSFTSNYHNKHFPFRFNHIWWNVCWRRV